uniref:Uncharacterized protein n=1 Tax=Lepeophtheirus salmonis TaxID=72036 RepID=A0A0K2UT13_LEPSM
MEAKRHEVAALLRAGISHKEIFEAASTIGRIKRRLDMAEGLEDKPRSRTPVLKATKKKIRTQIKINPVLSIRMLCIVFYLVLNHDVGICFK